jgi:hypothetical protein
VPAFEAAGVTASKVQREATRIFGELQAAAMREARKVEGLAPYATPENVRVVVSVALGLPACWVACTALGLWPCRRASKAVPRSVVRDSVPLRTPTPEKRTAGRTGGGTIRSPDGEDVLRFA